MKKYIAYYRVSTTKQGKSGLGLEAQKEAVKAYLQSQYPEALIAEYVEVESGKQNDRPELAAALNHCDLANATLLIAKLDRLSRNVGFIAQLQEAGTKFVCADMPEANETMIQIMSVMAQAERKAISERTKKALAAKKAQGFKLGNPNLKAVRNTDTASAIKKHTENANERKLKLLKVVEGIKAEGATTLREIANVLNERGYSTTRGAKFSATTVKRIVDMG